MQYFERSLFEYHPENSEPNNVLLTHLGRIEYDTNHPEPENIVTGEWGGPGIFVIEDQGRLLMRLDCDLAETEEPIVAVLGQFDVKGWYSPPPLLGRYYSPPVPVRFTGTLEEGTLSIGVYTREGEYFRGVFKATRGGKSEFGECATSPYVEPIRPPQSN